MRKRTEHVIKVRAMGNKSHEISSIKPVLYRERFRNFFERHTEQKQTDERKSFHARIGSTLKIILSCSPKTSPHKRNRGFMWFTHLHIPRLQPAWWLSRCLSTCCNAVIQHPASTSAVITVGCKSQLTGKGNRKFQSHLRLATLTETPQSTFLERIILTVRPRSR